MQITSKMLDEVLTKFQEKNYPVEKEGIRIHDWSEFTLHYKLSLQRIDRQRESIRERVKKWRK